MPVRLYDAHNHLQDDRFGGCQEELIVACRREGICRMVVNGSCEEDWPLVADLARRHPDLIIPSFGYHPWYVPERSADWQRILLGFLDDLPQAALGEIGIDRWKKELNLPEQEEVFLWQWRLAVERNLPVTIHCLQAWGRLHELLQAAPGLPGGFVLHSYGGSQEMIGPLAKLGAYFSFPGYYTHERKIRQRDTFKNVPPERLLIETDAPDQLLPDELNAYPLTDPISGGAIHHPANLGRIYRCVAELRGEPLEALAESVEKNFARVFGSGEREGIALRRSARN